MLSSAKKLTKKIENNFQKLIENDTNSGMGNLGELIFQKQEKYRQELVDYQLRNNISSVYWKTIIWKEEIFRFPVIIVFTNLIDHHSHEDDEDCLSFSGLQILTI